MKTKNLAWGASFIALSLISGQANANTVVMQKQNTDFSIDGNHNASQDGLQVYLWSTDVDNVNQQWVEISRGDDYYSYQKQGTSLCIDGGNNGANLQSVILLTCNDTNQNQHWKKVSTGGDSYRLEKRNAPRFSIDGNHGAENRQGLYLWASNNSNVNQQWEFITSTAEDSSPLENSITLPGLIEAEDFITESGVILEAVSDVNGGQSAAYIDNGDYSEYQIFVPEAGTYTLNARVSSNTNGGTINLQSDGVNAGAVSVSNTGGWQEWTTVSSTIDLDQGNQTLRLTFNGDDGYLFNVNWLTLEQGDTNFVPTTISADFVSPTPENNATLDVNADINIQVDASDIEGNIEEVLLYLDNQFIARQRVAQYVFSSTRQPELNGLEPGTYQLRADISNDQGDVTSITTSFNIVDTNVNPGPDVVDNNGDGCTVSGDLRQWHRVDLTCDGPIGSDSDDDTFTDNRFNVTFTNGSRTLVVPGHFAADGSAADTSATSGDQWRAYFSPPETGTWDYQVSFRTGNNIAVETNSNAGNAVSGIDGERGSFTVAGSGNVTRDMRTRGLLQHLDGERKLRFAGTNDVFVEGGMDSPENIFGYDEFDNTVKFDNVNSCKGIRHEFDPHRDDWNSGDPTWGNNRGRNLIGLVNYISSKGVNAIYIMMNTVNGDGCDAHPWTNYNSNGQEKSYDVSKLDQWERVLSHMTENGILIHAMTQEAENDHLINDGELGLERKLYYRELISRFGHHPALQWNLGEEPDVASEDLMEYSEYFKTVDPYQHPVFMHSAHTSSRRNTLYSSMLGDQNFDGPSGQDSAINESDYGGIYGETQDWIERSTDAGNTWVVTWTEASGNQAPEPFMEISSTQRIYWMWASVMSGGGGFEWYLKNDGAGHAYDLAVENLREFDVFWEQSGHLVSFFRDTVQTENDIDLDNLNVDNDAIEGDDDWVLSDSNSTYIALLRRGGNASLNLASNNDYDVQWFNPRTGESIDGGSVSSDGSLGNPPSQQNEDWAVILTRSDVTTTTPSAPESETDYVEQNGLVVIEAENTKSNLDQWVEKTDVSGFTGSSYIEFTGNSPLNGPAVSPLEYTFTVNQSGLYFLHMYVARETLTINGESRTDIANDGFIRLDGDYGPGPNVGNSQGDHAPLADLQRDTKYFGGNDNRFVWQPAIV